MLATMIEIHDDNSPFKINKTFGSQNHYETYSSKHYTVQAPMKMCGFQSSLF